MKTFNKKDVFSWSNAEDAKQYIGKKGYFANKLSVIEAMVQCYRNGDQYILQEIDCDDSLCFSRKIAGNIGSQWDSLFLPTDKIKEVEPKKWRPFKDIDEFCISTDLDVGKRITVRRLQEPCKGLEQDSLILSFFRYPDGKESIWISSALGAWNLKDLFKQYEFKNEEGDWQPFGMQDE